MNEKVKIKHALQGKVISDKMDKTVTVLIERKVKHPLYGKYVKRYTKVHAHDVNNECKNGNVVLVEESRPISKTKCWIVSKILERAT